MEGGRFKEILEESPVGDLTYSPYEMYIKNTLGDLRRWRFLEGESLPQKLENILYDFQNRNAKLLIKKLEKYGLAMLADSVGLGKTITAGAVLKYYQEEKGCKRIYVIAPAGLGQQWKTDLARFVDLHNVEVLSMENLNEVDKASAIDRYAEVDLFIVDEAHNLRSDKGKRHQKFLEWFANNPKSKVLLLTATPINNKLVDLSNQIQLAAKGQN